VGAAGGAGDACTGLSPQGLSRGWLRPAWMAGAHSWLSARDVPTPRWTPDVISDVFSKRDSTRAQLLVQRRCTLAGAKQDARQALPTSSHPDGVRRVRGHADQGFIAPQCNLIRSSPLLESLTRAADGAGGVKLRTWTSGTTFLCRVLN
jgi:hypothetical protein